MRAIFRARRRRPTNGDVAAQPPGSGLGSDGWQVVDALPPEVLEDLRSWSGGVLPQPVGPYYASSVHAERTLAAAVDREVKDMVSGALSEVLPGFDVFLASIIAKGPLTSGEVGFHFDWTFTDERSFRTVMCWMPLVDTDHTSGAMRVITGSHEWSNGLRPAGTALPTDDLQERLADCATTVPMRAGQALVYDPALIHGSWPNTATHDRVAIAAALAPAGAPILHFHDDEASGLQGFEVDNTYFTAQEFGSIPSGARPFEPWTGVVTPEEIVEGLKRNR